MYRLDAVHDPEVQPRKVPLGIDRTLARIAFDGSSAVDNVAPRQEKLVDTFFLHLTTNLALDGVADCFMTVKFC